MLSILIPVYNIDCSPLVCELDKQFEKSIIDYEILCFDDASTIQFNKNDKLNNLKNTSFVKLKENIGRSRIRNLLAKKAEYQWLLFLDADTLPTNDQFIEKYLAILSSNHLETVFNGGLSYREKDRTNKNQLRYKYGKSRESISSKKRNLTPYNSLLMSNTLIKKSIFNNVKFNESITKYGHEDSLFSFDLKEKKIKVKHIDNPVFHTGIEENIVFVNKSKIAIENLWYLYQKGLFKPEMNKLLKWQILFKKVLLQPLLVLFFIFFKKVIEKSLLNKNPSLLLFDLYRLCYLSFIAFKNKRSF
jgi:cellulose synthase/poly-beta-1,6-N-acetylglucosamine synthase-like glycosyltransferase